PRASVTVKPPLELEADAAGIKPYFAITACPSGDRTSATKAFARSGFLLSEMGVMGYVAIVFRASGISSLPIFEAASAVTSVTYTIPASASPRDTLVTTDLT